MGTEADPSPPPKGRKTRKKSVGKTSKNWFGRGITEIGKKIRTRKNARIKNPNLKAGVC